MSSLLMAMVASGAVPAPSDPYFKNVTMLLHGDGTNGAQNNTFIDSSPNNFTITRNGNVTQGSFSPYGALWSNYFDGTGDYLSLPASSSWVTGSSGSVTIEFWANADANSYYYLMDQGAGNEAAIAIGFGVSTGYIYWYNGNASVFLANISSLTIPAGTWNHFAFVINAGVPKVYLNGVLQSGTYTNNAFGVNATLDIGRYSGGTSYNFKGYISNFRFVSGQALYTANFTPSTTPLTAVSGTSLLTCQSNRFIDNSSNAFAVTVNGNTSVQRFSPFAPSAAYSTATIGGSGYFDGSGDYLTSDMGAALALPGAFTIECWCYPTANSSAGAPQFYVINNEQTGGVGVAADGYSSGGVYLYTRNTSYDLGGGVGSRLTLNQWNHVAVVRDSSFNTSIFVNGVRTATANITKTYTSASGNNQTYGYAPWYGGYSTGWQSGLRVVNGTAVYDPTQATLTVPTAPLTAITNTQLLLNFTNAGIYDNAMMNDLETVGNAQISTSTKKYGTGSLAFDGSGDWLLSAFDALSFGTGDFTIECWVYPVGNSGDTYTAYVGGNTDNASRILFGTKNSNNRLVIEQYGVGEIAISSAAISKNTWTYVAVTRSSGSYRLFINGTIDGTGTSSNSIGTGGCVVGAAAYANGSVINSALNGYIDDLRITKGYARYTANFTPPAQAFPNN